jgi:hypothetical protein
MLMEPYRMPCAVDGCSKYPTGRNTYCPGHHHIATTRGHPEQPPVYQYLKPHIHRVTNWSKSPDGEKAMAEAVRMYERQCQSYRNQTADSHTLMHQTGVKNTSPQAAMAEIITAVSLAKDSRKTLIQLIAYGVMWNEDHRSFKSDTAALYEATNVYLRGSKAARRPHFNKTKGTIRTKEIYLRQPTRKALGQWLMQHWVVLGVTLSREWNRKLALELREKRELADLIKSSA